MQPGTQIAYVPQHVMDSLGDNWTNHPDVEFGFVMAPTGSEDTLFCRYWRKGKPGELRTVANSEATPIASLVEYRSVLQDVVDATISSILEEYASPQYPFVADDLAFDAAREDRIFGR